MIGASRAARRPSGAHPGRSTALALVLLGAACQRPEPPPPPPLEVPPGLEVAMYGAVLERVLLIDLFQDTDVAAVCLGLGEAAEPPPMELLLRFLGGQPPLFGSGSCVRSVDPRTSLPVVGLFDGAPAAFVQLTHEPARSGRLVSMRVERSGMRPMLIRCRVDIAEEAHADPSVPGGEAIGLRLRSC